MFLIYIMLITHRFNLLGCYMWGGGGGGNLLKTVMIIEKIIPDQIYNRKSERENVHPKWKTIVFM
jgi:hypothetical protein